MNTLEERSLEGPFASAQISHADIADFAVDCVNLNREDAQEYREQVGRLRDKLDKYARTIPTTVSSRPCFREASQRARR